MKKIKSIYLANPYGFSIQQKELLLPQLVNELTRIGLSVYEPFTHTNQTDYDNSLDHVGYLIGQSDKNAVSDCDGFFGVVNGNPPDEGVMIELGIAIALGKPTFLFRDDFRKYNDSNEYPLNLMLFTGLPQDGWQDYFYTSIHHLCDPAKALYKWAVDHTDKKSKMGKQQYDYKYLNEKES